MESEQLPVEPSGQAPVTEPSVSASAPAYAGPTAEEWAAAQAELAAARQLYATLEPHAERVRRLVEDPEYGEFADQGFDAYKHMRESRKPAEPEVPEWARPIVEDYRTNKQSLEAQQRAEHDKWVRDNVEFAQRLAAEHPYLKEKNRLKQLGAFADSLSNVEGRRVGIEEAWKIQQGFAPRATTPPPSLRADSGAAGIPDNTPANADAYRKDFHGEMVRSLKRSKAAS